jgi:hypothetical protein
MRNLNWKPKLKGNIYCSSACGGGCNRKDYDKAVKAGKKWANKLGRGWKYRVWENLGWHVKVLKNEFCIHLEYGKPGCAYLNPVKNIGGFGNFYTHGNQPIDMMKKMVTEAIERRDNLNTTIVIAQQVIEEMENK